jgi:uncharacterized membrane protein
VSTSRLEAFSDGVIAILITIMVLELHVPEVADWHAIADRHFVLLAYLLSFVFLGIYWVNHHHMLHVTEHVTGGILWANLHLLFWLSLVPFTTGWMGEFPYDTWPSAIYGMVLFAAGVAYWLLQTIIIRAQGEHSALAEAVGADLKGKSSPALYAVAIALAFVRPWMAQAVYVLVALIWIVPDRRIESRLSQR